jgi:hypothetical protein
MQYIKALLCNALLLYIYESMEFTFTSYDIERYTVQYKATFFLTMAII